MNDMTQPVLKVEDLTLEFPHRLGAFPALKDVNFHIEPGEIIGLVGESGSGKSVTAMSVLRLLPEGSALYRDGKILVLENDMLKADPRQLRKMRGATAAMIFQEPMNALNPTIRIGRQITQVIRTHEKQVGKSQAEVRARQLLIEMQVQDVDRVMLSYPFELSGGLRQRVLIAMAFSCNPSLLIADEPTTALDVTVQAQVLGLLRERARERGMAVLFITHDLAVVSQLCDRAYVMYAGRIIEQGTTREVLQEPLHPYTRALLQSLPEASEPKHYLAAIPGTAASAGDRLGGCSFSPRCSLSQEQCSKLPQLLASRQSDGHKVACWRSEDAASRSSKAPPRMMATAADGGVDAAPMLSLTDVEVRFPVGRTWLGRPRSHVHALNGVSLDVRRGETLGIVGESGCGKSTLSQVVMGLQQATAGHVVFDGNDLSRQSPKALKKLRQNFQIVFQDPQGSLDPRMSVEALISEPLVVAGELPTAEIGKRVLDLAQKVGLRPEQLSRYPHQFSGGQRQRIAIARALALQPDLVVLDEPTSALDVSVQAQILNLLADLQQQMNLTYLFISHNVAVIRHFADRVAVMYLGQVVELGNARDVLERPAHPYTRALLAAVPKLEQDATLLQPSRNVELPSNRNLPTGCFFKDRCDQADNSCSKPQMLRAMEDSRSVRCIRPHQFDAENTR